MDKVRKMMERGMKNNNGKRGAIWEGKKGDLMWKEKGCGGREEEQGESWEWEVREVMGKGK
jgi:hypothetical protein